MTSTSGPIQIIRAANEGEKRWFFGGGVHTWKATAEETAGAFFLFEISMQRGKLTPLHTHPEADETMYVLEGEILMHIDGREYPIAAGGLVMAPRGVPHAFLVVSGEARILCLLAPGCGQAFYFGASEPIDASNPAPQTVDFARVQASAHQNGGIEIVGPPPFTQP